MKSVLLVILLLPMFVFAQNYSENMDKVQTLKFINSVIKPDGNTGSVSSIGTKISYTENYYDLSARKQYELNLAQVSITKGSGSVILKCTSGNCIKSTFKAPDKEEIEEISSLTFKTDKVNDLYNAFILLKKRVGL